MGNIYRCSMQRVLKYYPTADSSTITLLHFTPVAKLRVVYEENYIKKSIKLPIIKDLHN